MLINAVDFQTLDIIKKLHAMMGQRIQTGNLLHNGQAEYAVEGYDQESSHLKLTYRIPRMLKVMCNLYDNFEIPANIAISNIEWPDQMDAVEDFS